MEVAAELSHGEKEIRGQKDHEKAGRQTEISSHEGAGRQHDADRCAAAGEKVHDDDGIELHREHFHRDYSEMLRFLVHLLVFELVRLVDLESRHALQVFEEGAAELGVLAPIFCQDLLGDLLHHHDRPRDQRHEQQKDEARLPASGRRKEDEQGERRDERVEELRHILAKIALKLVYSLHRLLHDLRSGHFLAVAHAEFEEFLIDQVAELALYGAGGEIAHPHCESGDKKANEDRHRDDHKGRDRAPGCQFAPVELLRRECDQADHHRVQKKLKPLQDDVSRNVFFAFGAQGH